MADLCCLRAISTIVELMLSSSLELSTTKLSPLNHKLKSDFNAGRCLFHFAISLIHPQLWAQYICSDGCSGSNPEVIHIPSLFQIIPVLLEDKIPQKITKVAIVCSRLLHITTNTNGVTLHSPTTSHAFLQTHTHVISF